MYMGPVTRKHWEIKTKGMERDPAWEDNSRSADKKIAVFYGPWMYITNIHTIPPLEGTQSQLNAVST
jgi:hypothetical protein